MEILQTKETIMSFADKRRAHVYIEESKTAFYVAFRPVGWASWFTTIKVKKCKAVAGFREAALAAYEAYMKNNIWNW